MGEQLILCKLCDPPRRHRLGERHVVKGFGDDAQREDRPSGSDGPNRERVAGHGPNSVPDKPRANHRASGTKPKPRGEVVQAGSVAPLDKLTSEQLRQRVIAQRAAKRIAQAKWRAKRKTG